MTFQAPTAPAIGTLIAGKYRIEEQLGSGGMGTLFVAGHELSATRVAIKFLAPHLLSQESSVARFLREARAVAQLSSEHIVRVMDVGLENGHPYLVMELLEGRDLYEALKVDGPFPVAEAVDCVLQVLAGIAEAHAAGIVHRDLKPANIFIAERSDGDIVKVLDFPSTSESSSFSKGGSGFIPGRPKSRRASRSDGFASAQRRAADVNARRDGRASNPAAPSGRCSDRSHASLVETESDLR
jgi:serine/threonine-protein kinase